MKKYFLRYDKPAEDSEFGWENYSIPIGNGFMGANIFGGVIKDRIQISENSFCNPGESEPKAPNMGGLTNFAEIYIEFADGEFSDYKRGLCLNNAVAYTGYIKNNISYERKYFLSHKDRVMVITLDCSKAGGLEFSVSAKAPFVREFFEKKGDRGGRYANISVDGDCLRLWGELCYYHILYEMQIKILSDGRLNASNDKITVSDATHACLIVAAGTNYTLCSDVFNTDDPLKKTLGEDPHIKVSEYIKKASSIPEDELLKRHTDDFSHLFERVSLDLGGTDNKKTTTELLDSNKEAPDKYLEEMYFQYGRYLLICSSRKGGLPANLQGIWTCHERSPWGAGYWHNINVQMNYWHAFSTNLAELFEPYADFFLAFYDKAKDIAQDYIKQKAPENYAEGKCGFAIGTAAYPYYITPPGRHSGPGTVAFTSKLFWDWYNFTGEDSILKKITKKVLKGASEFLTKTVKNYDGEFLVSFSASPEQMHNGMYVRKGRYYQTVGCSFDQQFLWENGKDYIKVCELTGEKNELFYVQKKQIDAYHPVRIGKSGQIKEFIEEDFYGEIGEYAHRHISQLVGLYPGTLITDATDAWQDAARYTLDERGTNTSGWALAHRLCCRARLGDSKEAYELLRKILTEKTNYNLWDMHPPFQIDGNFGATAGIAEMLVQSHDDCIHILPALPKCWDNGCVRGLCARGAFVIDIVWKNEVASFVTLKSLKGNTACIKAEFSKAFVSDSHGNEISFKINGDILEFETEKDQTYTVKGFSKKEVASLTENVKITSDFELSWDGGPCDIFRAVDDESKWQCIAKNVTSPFKDDYKFDSAYVLRYKVGNVKNGKIAVINRSTELERDIYKNIVNSKRRDEGL